MSEEMRNPYEKDDGFPCEVMIPPAWCLVISILFFIAISIPPIWRSLNEFYKPAEERWIPIMEIANTDSVEAANVLNEKRRLSSVVTRTKPSFRDHLQAFEAGVKQADFRLASRKVDQARQLLWLRDGNRRVYLGRNGWLYYQPEIDGLTGYGPLRPEPDSVTKDPDRAEWNQPAEVVLHFAEQLKERGIQLTLVPVPTKPMIHPEGITAHLGTFIHPDYEKMLDQFREAEIEVVDLVPVLSEDLLLPAFLQQDTHWTVEAMQLAADRVAKSLQGSVPPGPLKVGMESVVRRSKGDLVKMMGLPDSVDIFDREAQRLNRVIDTSTGKVLTSDPDSPVVVIGDSFVNIYEDPSIGFEAEEGDTSPIGAGFASHLAANLKTPVHVIAINGEGATGVRRAFAALPDNRVKAKKQVVWVLSARDLLFSETTGLRAGVYWRDVEFNPEVEKDSAPDATAGELVVSAVLKEKSGIQNPAQTPYADAVYSGIFEIKSVDLGVYDGEELCVFLWAFRDRKMKPTSTFEPGKTYRLRIAPIESLPEVKTRTRLDDFFRIDLTPMFATEAEEVTSPQ